MDETLQDHLYRIGDVAASRLLGVKIRAVAAWRRGERLPRPKQAQRIARLTGLPLEAIYPEQRRD